MLDPAQTMDKLVSYAGGRADRPVMQMMASSVLAGAYLSFGGCLYMLARGNPLPAPDSHPAHLSTRGCVYPMPCIIFLLAPDFGYGCLGGCLPG